MDIYTAKWISTRPQAEKQGQAYYYRKVFDLEKLPEAAELYCAAAGFYEVMINGVPVSDRVLATAPTQYDYRVEYTVYPIKELLRIGRNVIVFHIGNGYYNCFEQDHWKLDRAPYRDFPKIMAYLQFDGKIAVRTDDSWKAIPSGVVYNSLRRGEFYDANQDVPDVHNPFTNNTDWKNAVYCNPPGGKIVPEQGHPCVVQQRIEPVGLKVFTFGRRIYDFGVSIAGWCEVTFTAPPGTTIYLEYGEMVNDIGDVTREYINHYGEDSITWQEDRFTVGKSGRLENAHAHFTWYGFRYVRMRAEHPDIKIEKIQACVIFNSFPQLGAYSTSDYVLNKLFELTKRSFESNFVGIPTDCPHREKSGWHGDVNRASETGLFMYDVASDYGHYLDALVGTQRANGQIPAVAPSGAHFYNWGSEPAITLFWVPLQIYNFTGNDEYIRKYYGNMALHLDFCRQKLQPDGFMYDNIGDWCPVEHFRMTEKVHSGTLDYYLVLQLMHYFARHLGKEEDAAFYAEQKQQLKDAYRKAFYKGDGIVGDDTWTTLGFALCTDLFNEEEGRKIAANLVSKVRANQHKVDFGNIGGKVVHHALSRYGYVEDAYKLLTQTEYPGYGHWVKAGATTLWETWSGLWSRNHIMFGDLVAWFFKYLGGINLKKGQLSIRPCFVSGLDDFCCHHTIPGKGTVHVDWKRENGKVLCHLKLTEGLECSCSMPGHQEEKLQGPVEREYIC
ncbi:MAG: family 78 glycoside hydrolase catalytic domain [Victivallales bacterium]|nr:family 78 glycoside hydrolase catalytic domain [Victivallales bacterium]